MTFKKALTANPEKPGVSGHMVGETGANAANGLGVAGAAWLPIESAPKDEVVLLYGKLRPHPDNAYLYANLDMDCRCTGYWDQIDEAWCPVGSTWEGPWLEPTHWMPLPPTPTPEARHD